MCVGPLTWVPQNEPYNFHWEFNVRIPVFFSASFPLTKFIISPFTVFPRSHYFLARDSIDAYTRIYAGLEFRRWEYDARERDDARADGYRGVVYRAADVRLFSMHPSSLSFLSTPFERIPSSSHHPSTLISQSPNLRISTHCYNVTMITATRS